MRFVVPVAVLALSSACVSTGELSSSTSLDREAHLNLTETVSSVTVPTPPKCPDPEDTGVHTMDTSDTGSWNCPDCGMG